MDSSLYVASPPIRLPETAPTPPVGNSETLAVLRQVLEVQREQLNLMRAQQAANDNMARWKAFLARWQDEFPRVGTSCKEVLPMIERCYLTLIQEFTDRVREEDTDLDSEFVLSEFLDRYGVKISQLGNLLGQLGPIADATPHDPHAN
ncbi:MAG: hypothetical protein ACRC8S_02835 [Fimbriiglobus sp.]